MNKKEYKDFVKESEKGTLKNLDKINHAMFGMAGEIGECIDYLKKVIFHGHEYSPETFLNELGDLLWYVTLFSMCYEEKYSTNLSYFDKDKLDFSTNHVDLSYYGRTHLFKILTDTAFVVKHLIVEKPFTDFILNGYIEEIYYNIEALCFINDIDIFNLIDINVKKIRTRYPNGFDTMRSINRDNV